MSEDLKAAYIKYAPKWFKVIRWRQWATYVYIAQPKLLFFVYAPTFLYFYVADVNAYTLSLMWNKPTTQEEREKLKHKWFFLGREPTFIGRNWEMGQYHGELPPTYDVWQRRKKYPEYYGKKYDTFARDAYCDTHRDGYFDIHNAFVDKKN